MTRARNYPVPPADRTIQLLGDLHFGEPAFTLARQQAVIDDVTRWPALPKVKHRLQLGDLTDSGTEDAAGLAFMRTLCADGSTPLYCVGNHDMYGSRTATAAAAAWGLPSKDYTLDLGYAFLVVLGPDHMLANATGLEYYNPGALSWLDTQLAGQRNSRPVIVAAHPPLMNTEKKLSNSVDFSAQPDSAVRAVLANHSARLNLAWVSGHTHSPITTVDLAKAESVGTGTVMALNTSCLSHLSAAKAWTDHLITFFLTVQRDRWEVRFRNHGAHQWVGGSGATIEQRVWSLPFAA